MCLPLTLSVRTPSARAWAQDLFYSASDRKITVSTKEVTTLAGDSSSCYSGCDADGTGTNAVFDGPYDLTIAPTNSWALIGEQ